MLKKYLKFDDDDTCFSLIWKQEAWILCASFALKNTISLGLALGM